MILRAIAALLLSGVLATTDCFDISKFSGDNFLFAALSGDLKSLEAILGKGRNVNQPEPSLGFTALHCAAASGQVDVLQFLLRRQASVDCQSKNGHSPLHVAAAMNRMPMVLELLEAGANPHLKDSNGFTPMIHAAGIKRTEMVEAMLRRAKNREEISLHIAVSKGLTDIAEFIISAGANYKKTDAHGRSLLHTATEANNTKIVERLLEVGMDPNVTSGDGKTPLHIAADKGYADIVHALLKAGANRNPLSAPITPLNFAQYRGNREIMALLSDEVKCNQNMTKESNKIGICKLEDYPSILKLRGREVQQCDKTDGKVETRVQDEKQNAQVMPSGAKSPEKSKYEQKETHRTAKQVIERPNPGGKETEDGSDAESVSSENHKVKDEQSNSILHNEKDSGQQTEIQSNNSRAREVHSDNLRVDPHHSKPTEPAHGEEKAQKRMENNEQAKNDGKSNTEKPHKQHKHKRTRQIIAKRNGPAQKQNRRNRN